ncbi:MAG: hypothetical protein EXR36_06285 [Betaproteobacteria bacterium]|nr:hypothetical protein [Betaproteobacteria bacterium]
MNTRLLFGIGTLPALAILTALQANAGANDPVCTMARDVSSVSWRASAPSMSAHCFVERKVTANASGLDVSNILGRSAPPITLGQNTEATVASRDLRGSPVEVVMGRSGGSIPAKVRKSEQSVARDH